MPNLTIKQAAIFTGRDEKTVRRWILGSAGKNPRIPTHARDSKGRYLIAQSDLERILVEDAIASFDEPRFEALEARIEALEQRLDELQSAPTRPSRSPPVAHETPTVSSSTLPDGWIPINDLIKQYHAPRSTAMRHMRPFIHTGRWRVGGHEVTNALDEAGQAEFIKQFGNG